MEEKKRLLFVVEAMGGGVFTYITNLSNILVEEFDLYIAYAIRPQTPKDYFKYFDEKIHLIHVKTMNRELNLLNDLKAYIFLKKLNREIKPDIIHFHSSKAGVLGRCAFNGHKIPLFYTPHGYSFLMNDQSKIRQKFYFMIESLMAKKNCMTISCSSGEHQITLKMTSNAKYINNGIDILELDNVINNIQFEHTKKFTIFTLGRICNQKTPSLFNQIAQIFPDISFVWIGDGELRKELTSSNIIITGWVERKKAIEYALEADVFLLTSSWEGLPISLLEAMYMKKICIVSDVIGNRDVIQNEKNGFVCKTLDEYVTTIKNLFKIDCRKIKEQAREDILSEYNTKVMAEKYSKLYHYYVKNDFA